MINMPPRQSETEPLIWVHAVSVGEVAAAKPLVDALLARDKQILITTMTPTGSEHVRTLFGTSVAHSYLPYDLPSALKRFINQCEPQLLVIMETELWPNLIHVCHQASIPSLLLNARMSERSASGYQKLAGLTNAMLSQLHAIAAQTPEDRDRLVKLGAKPSTTVVTGSLKFHSETVSTEIKPDDFFHALQQTHRDIIIAASTREGEETKVLDAFSQVLSLFPKALLLLVPRHPERFDSVAKLAVKKGFSISRRSEGSLLLPEHQVVIGDSMGELLQYYCVAKIAFVGGSLVDTGCQNVLEPAAQKLPVVVGPSQFNFAAICQQLEKAGGLVTVQNTDELAQQIIRWLESPGLAVEAGARGRGVVDANQQALASVLKLIDSTLEYAA